MTNEIDGKEHKLEPAVLLETEDVLVISKPYGLIVHGDGKDTGPTLVDWFLNHTPASAGVGEEATDQQGNAIDRSGVVHRLDRETSGVMIMAKTQEAFEQLKYQFHERQVKKEYRAFVYGRINDRWGTINRPIGRHTNDPRRRSAERGAKGVLREAITEFERIGMGEYKEEPFSYIKLFPKTGRTHQLRAHLRAVDRPIVGDTLYAEYKTDRSNHLDCDRLMLHAHKLELTLPDGTDGRFLAPLPEQFERAAERIEEEPV